jgi:hypothetical protein
MLRTTDKCLYVRAQERMNQTGRRFAFAGLILFLLFAICFGLISYYFGVEVTTKGEAQGFIIGDRRTAAYDAAAELLRKGEITEIHVWPKDEFHRPLQSNENPENNTDPRWVLVVNPEWWNNTITLTFEHNVLVEIRRDRICCELP